MDNQLTMLSLGLDPDSGKLMTLEEFKDAVLSGGYSDYDGFGEAFHERSPDSRLTIIPSKVHTFPAEYYTHVIWYNK